MSDSCVLIKSRRYDLSGNQADIIEKNIALAMPNNITLKQIKEDLKILLDIPPSSTNYIFNLRSSDGFLIPLNSIINKDMDFVLDVIKCPQSLEAQQITEDCQTDKVDLYKEYIQKYLKDREKQIDNIQLRMKKMGIIVDMESEWDKNYCLTNQIIE